MSVTFEKTVLQPNNAKTIGFEPVPSGAAAVERVKKAARDPTKPTAQELTNLVKGNSATEGLFAMTFVALGKLKEGERLLQVKVHYYLKFSTSAMSTTAYLSLGGAVVAQEALVGPIVAGWQSLTYPAPGVIGFETYSQFTTPEPTFKFEKQTGQNSNGVEIYAVYLEVETEVNPSEGVIVVD